MSRPAQKHRDGGQLRGGLDPSALRPIQPIGELRLLRAMQELAGEARLEIIPAATHLFEEPGTLEDVARLARDWFVRHLRGLPPWHPIRDDNHDVRGRG